jgi:phospholipid N-methyltransferase
MNISIEKLIRSLPSKQKVHGRPADYGLAIVKHPFFKEAKEKIFEIAQNYLDKNSRILEYGAGTGNLTETLINLPFGDFLVTEDDRECFEFLKKRLGDNQRLRFELRDITQKFDDGPFDAIFSCVVDHHIPPDKKIVHFRNLFSQLKSGCVFIVCEELIDGYTDQNSYVNALKNYYGVIIKECIENGHFDIAKIEALALKNGIDGFDEYKISKKQYLENIQNAGFRLVLVEKMGPEDGHDHGVYVIVAQKP